MKFSIKIILLLILAMNFCKAQDTTILVTPDMFDKPNDQIILSAIDGWIFKKGNNPEWGNKDIDLTGWKKLNPSELTVNDADSNGRVECWFRLKIKLDSNFGYDNFAFRVRTWAATDLFINGNHAISSGNTGAGSLFRENRPFGRLPVPFELKPGNEYTIALHFVDYVAPLLPPRLKSESLGLQYFLRLTGPNYDAAFLDYIKTLNAYSTIWISVCTALSLLFWLLTIQNRDEKNLLLIALCTTFFALSAIATSITQGVFSISYTGFYLSETGDNIFNTMLSIIMILVLASIFKQRVTRKLEVFLILYFITGLSTCFLSDNISGNIWGVLIGALLLVSVYYIVSSWKNLEVAQWVIVAGIIISTIWAFLYFIVVVINSEQDSTTIYLYTTGVYLSFPLSLLVYVAMRFREIINDVRQNADQVVRLSDEKKQQALNQQKILEEEVNRQTKEIRTTLDNLKSTQSQLIQSEKMASLGELTAGIAHEIQNPLNFVNNFSEVNTELIAEMKDEIGKGNLEDVKLIANNIEENEQKIKYHGKRAEVIVKGMLQHSRTSSGQKEPTNINVLADEYLRLAYHGLRAKDKSFNATIKTDFNESLGEINVVPQDIGRVILNLITNAFYAVTEKKNASTGSTGQNYEPTVEVITKKIDDNVEVRVKDNGGGISKKVLDKIFQPFFTTKPTGQGTGLGLSLSYDIIKAHSGVLKVETKEGEGSEFIIKLPV